MHPKRLSGRGRGNCAQSSFFLACVIATVVVLSLLLPNVFTCTNSNSGNGIIIGNTHYKSTTIKNKNNSNTLPCFTLLPQKVQQSGMFFRDYSIHNASSPKSNPNRGIGWSDRTSQYGVVSPHWWI